MKNAIRFALRPFEQTKTRIMATIGQSTLEYHTMRDMVLAGASLFRFNGAHLGDELSLDQAEKIVGHIRRLRNERRQLLGIYFDLGGPKMRIQAILGVDTRQPECLHPPENAEVWIRPWDEDSDTRFKQLEQDFDAQKPEFWEDDGNVRRFFGNAGERYELMFGPEVKHLRDFATGGTINLKDGWCSLHIQEVDRERDLLRCIVKSRDSKFIFLPHQGANPFQHIFPDVITKKDIEDIDWALQMGADVISLSFVCSSTDAFHLRRHVDAAKLKLRKGSKTRSAIYQRYLSEKHRIPLFAKIETVFAVQYEHSDRYAKAQHIDRPDHDTKDPLAEIADAFDGLMVARGDLAVEVAKYEVPALQRRIIEVARLKNKPVIVATEMLESMKRGDASTRAEIGDINTAVHQGADILMLSGETARTKGKPEEAVKEMRRAILQAESELEAENGDESIDTLERRRETEIKRTSDKRASDLAVSRLSQGAQVCLSARAVGSRAVIASAQTGETVAEIAYYRPRQSIVAITEDVLTGIRLLQYRGVYPVVMEHPLTRTVDDFIEIANQIHKEINIPMPAGSNSTFRLPGLIRIVSDISPDLAPEEIPNSIHVFTLPVEALAIPEIERKYVLSATSYGKLAASLRADAIKWQLISQQNSYFIDDKKALDRARLMIRVREERLIDSHNTNREHEEPAKVYLTLKGPAEHIRSDGSTERPEQEFDVSHEYPVTGSTTQEHQMIDALPATYAGHIVGKWWEELRTSYDRRDDVSFVRRAVTLNRRLRCTMSNGFVLELDESEFEAKPDTVFEWELEVEFHGGKSTSDALTDFIHDKFAWLDIPIVLEFPSKLQRTLFYADLLSEDRKRGVQTEIEEAKRQLDGKHDATCARCQRLALSITKANEVRS